MTSDVPSSSPSPWRSMHAAPKDGSPVLGLFKQTFASPHNDRAVEQWGGTQIVMRHPGLTNESYDCGWNLINGGTGGFPDDWFEGWMPLPVTSASAASSTGALREALSAARGNLEEIEVNALDVGTSNMAQSAIMEIDAALTASAAPSTEGLREWQPIETAPKDGTWILGWAEGDANPARISWGRNHNCQLAWCTAFCSLVEGYITHWMPLPPAPDAARTALAGVTAPPEPQIVTSHALPVTMWDRIATAVVKRVAELPDRTSPDDRPDAMLVTGEELHRIIMSEFDTEIG